MLHDRDLYIAAARSAGLSDGRYGYSANPGDCEGQEREAYLAGHAQGRIDRDAEPHRFAA